MAEFLPITTLAEYDALTADECVQGYRDGWRDPVEPGNNHTRSYWHGWRCAQMDAGRMPIPPDHHALVVALAARSHGGDGGRDG